MRGAGRVSEPPSRHSRAFYAASPGNSTKPFPTAPARRRNAAQLAQKELAEAQGELRKVQEIRAADENARAPTPTALVSLRALLLAGAFPLVPADKVPRSVRPGALYGEFTPVTLLAGPGDGGGVQLGAAAFKPGSKPGTSSSEGEAGAAAAAENGGARAAPAALDGGGRPGSAAPATAPSPTSAASSAAAKLAAPRRQPPPPPPKM